MFCPKCGKENSDAAEFCSSCGEKLKGQSASGSQDSDVGPLGIVLFCIPIVGAIMYFVWKDEKPEKAKKACWLALAGFGVAVIINIIYTVVQGM